MTEPDSSQVPGRQGPKEPGSRPLQEYLSSEFDKVPSQPSTANLLDPLLKALKWHGTESQLSDAFPHVDAVETIYDLRSVLYRLNYNTKPKNLPLEALKPAELPCLFETDSGQEYIVLYINENDKYVLLNTAAQEEVIAGRALTGTAYLIEPFDLESLEKEIEKKGWVGTLSERFRSNLLNLSLLTFVIGLLSLALPVFVISVYDNVINTKSVATLLYAIVGMGIIIGLEVLIRHQRLELIAYIGARLEYLLVRKAFAHLLKLPVSSVRAAPVGAQITRIKQFESITSIFTGTLAEAFLDIPLLVLFVVISFIIGGTLGWVSVGLIGIYAVIGFATIPMIRNQVSEIGEAKSRSRNFLLEILSKHRSLFYNGSLQVWGKRYSEYWSRYRQSHFVSTNTNFILHTLTQAFAVLAGIIILVLGTGAVIENELSLGALIALMIIIWRMLSPIQKIFLGIHRIGQVSESFIQVNLLTMLKPEQLHHSAQPWHRKFKGEFVVSNIALRYQSDSDPVLRNISLNTKPGELIAITGPTGSGKSTLLRVLLGLFQPQLGKVRLDGLDLRQIDLSELRHSIGYAPQAPEFFYGTIAQNLELAASSATSYEIEQVLRELRLWDELQKLPEGLNMRLKSKSKYHLTPEIRQQLCLARAFIKKTNIYILDAPTNNLGVQMKSALLEKLASLKGTATTLAVTHDRDLLMLADRVVVLSKGVVVADMPPEEIIKAAG